MTQAPAANRMPVVLDTRVVTESGGGPDKTILNSPRFFTAAGYKMLCAYMHPPGDAGFERLREKAAGWGAPLLSVPDRGPWDWRVIARMLHICRRQRVQIWHGHDYKSNALGLLLRRFWPMRLVTTVHGWVKETRRTPLYYKIDQLCLPRYEAVLCVSEDLHQQCLDHGVPAKRCFLIENGIDTQQYTRSLSTAKAKDRLGLSSRRFVIGAVGRLSPEKGLDLLIRAAHRLLTGGLDVAVLIAGEGAEKTRLESLANELGMRDRVHLLGYCADTSRAYAAMDVFALSSLREGLPNVLLEAMSMELPVIATRIAGVPRLVRDEVNGLLVEPGSIDSLAQSLTRIVTDDELRQRLRSSGRHTVETRYSFAKRIEKIRMIYDELLGRKRANVAKHHAPLPVNN
jgi:glycosyltransferase involved in cell wall biosynthesis